MCSCLAGIALSSSALGQGFSPGGASGFGGPDGAFGQQREEERPRQTGPVIVRGGPLVTQVRVVGNRRIPTSRIRSMLRTKINRPFDPETVQADVRELLSGQTKLFRDVRTYTQKTPDGIVVTYAVVELPTINNVRVIGNRNIATKTLLKETGLEDGAALDAYDVNEARRKIESFYQSRGYTKTQVSVLKGTRPEDREVIFLVSEDSKQRVWDVNFVGNTIVSDGRLKTQIESKPGFMKYLFKGNVDRQKIEEDKLRLTEYYRSLGYFKATVGREVDFDEDREWATITFVIDEGPQYQVRNVSVMGNRQFATPDLISRLELKQNAPYNAAKKQVDVSRLTDIYGKQGFIFVDVRPELRFLPEPGQVDLVYDISEGEQYRVGRINIHIAGPYPHTRENVVLNRISLRPGDIIDITELRKSERRLKASQLFLNEPHRGVAPKIVVRPPDLDSIETIARGQSPRPHEANFRGQSPDRFAPHSHVPVMDLDIYVPPGYLR